MLYSPDLNLIQFGFPGQVILKAYPLPDGRFIILKKDQLILASSSFEVVQQVAHGLPPVDVPIEMAVSDSSIWLLAATPPRQLLQYDPALHLVDTQTVPLMAPFQPAFVTSTAQGLTLLGEEYRAGASQVVSLRSGPAATITFDATPDAALLEIRMPHLPIDYAYTDPIGQYHLARATAKGNSWAFERNGLPAGIYQVLVSSVNGKKFAGKVRFD